MLSFVDQIGNHYEILIFIIVGLISIFLVFIALKFSNKRKKLEVSLDKQIERYKEINALPIPNAINKIEELASYNSSYTSRASSYTQRYLDNMQNFSSPISELISSIKSSLNENKHEEAKTKLKDLIVSINAFEKEANSLLTDIKNDTIDEEPLMQEIDRIKKAYNECIERYQDNYNDLVLVSYKIRSLMDNIEVMIREAEENIQIGVYLETKEIVNKIDKEIDYLREYLRVMPNLINLATKVIVIELKELIEKNNIMQEDYPIHHLMPIKRIEKLKKDVEGSIEKIKVLDYDGVEPLLKDIHNNIKSLSEALDHERDCRKEYDSRCESLYYSSDCTVRNFEHVKKDIDKVLQDYDSSEEITTFVKKCEDYKAQLKQDKQTMDNNIYGHQPYSVRLDNMNKLKAIIDEFQSHLDTFTSVAKVLEQDRFECLGKIKGYINYLRLSQIILDNCNLPSLTKRYREKINNIEDLISRLIYCLRRPYKVKTAKDICAILDFECKDLYGKVKYSQRLMNYTEKIIVIASRYRDKFQEVDYAVNRANYYFLDGDFEASKNIVEKLSAYDIVFPKFQEVEVK